MAEPIAHLYLLKPNPSLKIREKLGLKISNSLLKTKKKQKQNKKEQNKR
jgi:hypothetical protein